VATIDEAPGRRRARKPQRPRDALILDALERLLVKQPLRDLGVDEIARAAGITRTHFYHYFESKGEAYAALLHRLIQMNAEVYEGPAGWFARRPDVRPRDAMQTTFELVADLWWKNRFVLREASDLWNASEDARGMWLQMMQTASGHIAQAIEREREAGVAPAGPDAAEIADLLLWHNERVLFLASLESDPVTAAKRLELIHTTMPLVWLRTIYLSDDPDPAPD
jgi:AcrR family transcriptional regulator